MQDDRVGVVSFTGSSATGKLIQKIVSERTVLAKVCLELGGKNPFVVCDDADLELAAELAAASAFIDAGQRCASGSRIIVFDRVYDAFRSAFLARVAKVKVGSGPGRRLRSGDLTRQPRSPAWRRCSGAVVARRDAGDRRRRRSTSLAPGLLHAADGARERVAGRRGLAAASCSVRSRACIASAASTRRSRWPTARSYGLTGAIHTTNLHRAQEFITRYQGGLVSINGADLRRRPAHAVWRRQEFRQRLPRAGHRSARCLHRIEDGRRSITSPGESNQTVENRRLYKHRCEPSEKSVFRSPAAPTTAAASC